MVRSLRLCLVLLGGCASVFGDVEPPEVSLAGLAFDQPGLFEQRLRLEVRLRNPNDFQLDVERLLFDLEVNDGELGRGWTTSSFAVPAFGEAVVPVTIVVPTSDLIQRIIELGRTQRLDYRLKGEAKLTNATLRTVPFEQDGNFALPRIPVLAPAAPLSAWPEEVGLRGLLWSAACEFGSARGWPGAGATKLRSMSGVPALECREPRRSAARSQAGCARRRR